MKVYMYSLILGITSQWQPITIKSKLLLNDNTFKFLTSNSFNFHTVNTTGLTQPAFRPQTKFLV